jgi:acyl-coenzyme A synthetase/AMP-(fatty) acid ligase
MLVIMQLTIHVENRKGGKLAFVWEDEGLDQSQSFTYKQM